MKRVYLLPIFVVGVLVGLLLIQMFWNLDAPLLWNDEAETAEYGRRILQYGFPKAFDGKNYLNLLEHPDPSLGVEQSSGAYIVSGWVQYYIAALGVFIGSSVTDIYLRTLLIRLPFVFIGFIAIMVWFWQFVRGSISPFVNWRNIWMGALYLLLVNGSTNLLLHLREARYYAVLLLMLNLIVFLVIIRIFNRKSGIFDHLSLVVMVLLLGATFFPAFVSVMIWLTIMGTCSTGMHWYRGRLIDLYKLDKLLLLTGGISLIASPFILFSGYINLFQRMSELTQLNVMQYRENVLYIFRLLDKHAFLLPAMLLSAGAWVFGKPKKILEIIILWVLIFVYVLVTARVPKYYLFDRYYIVLAPLIIYAGLSSFMYISSSRLVFRSILLILVGSYLFRQIPLYQNWIFELRHGYRGPLDYVISYLVDTNASTEKIILATNYEEASYMFYLGCKVLVGYFGKNDWSIGMKPDYIIIRKYGESTIFPESREILKNMVDSGYFIKTFPIRDYYVNNIAELEYPTRHQFMTLYTSRTSDMVTMYEKNK